MAVDLVFKDKEGNELKLHANQKNELYIQIGDFNNGHYCGWISLNLEDAKKLSKEIKKQINIINENLK